MSLRNLKQKLQNKVNNMENSFENAGTNNQNNQYSAQNYSSQMTSQSNFPNMQYQQYNQQQYQRPKYNYSQMPPQNNQQTTQYTQHTIRQPVNNHQYTSNMTQQNQQYNKTQTHPNDQNNTNKTLNTYNSQKKMNFQNNTYQQKQPASDNQTKQSTNKQSQNNLIVPDAFNKYQQKYNQAHAQKGFLGKLKSKFKKAGTSNQIDTSGVDKFKNSIIDELGYKRLTNDNHHYLVLATPYHATRGYAEMLQIGGASLTNLPPDLADGIMIHFIHFLRAYMADMTFVSIHLPNDSKSQQHYWAGEKRDINYKILRGGLSYHKQEYLLARRKFINAKLKRFQDIDLSVDNQAFVMILFAKTEDELNRDVQYALAFDREGANVLKLSFMSVEQKETFLTRLNNPNISAR